jgi:hypothetical protein
LQRKKAQTKMESEKVYVHYQGHPEFTYIAKLDPLLTVAQLAQDFATAYRAKYGLQHMLDLSCIEVFSERHKPLMRSMVLKKVAKNRSDLFIELRAPELRATSLSPEEKVEIASAKQKNKKCHGKYCQVLLKHNGPRTTSAQASFLGRCLTLYLIRGFACEDLVCSLSQQND